MTDEELKPCPFCSAPAALERGSDHHGTWFNLGCSRHWGRVADPDKACIAGRMFYTEIEKTEAEAILLWNTRPDLAAETLRLRAEVAAKDAKIERLREVLKDVTDALEPFVDTDAELRKPYEHPLSAYDRARAALGDSHD